MPGKQMSIDAELNAGIITEQEALTRRAKIQEQADFYGAMDGASKLFVVMHRWNIHNLDQCYWGCPDWHVYARVASRRLFSALHPSFNW